MLLGQSEGTNQRQQLRLWDSYPARSPNLKHCQAHSQNKRLSRASRLRLALPSLETGRQGQPELEGGNCGPREASSTKLQPGFVANQDFLGFWMVDIHREGCSQRSVPQKRCMAHLRRCTSCTPRKPSGRDRGGNKSQPQLGVMALTKHLVT